MTRRPIFPTPRPPSLAAVTGGGVQGGGARPAGPGGGGGVNPTSMAQNDTHVALIILTTQMWGGGGGLLVEKTFSGQNLCSCAFGANIRSYTKQRARHGTPFLQPPPPPSAGVHVTPPQKSNFQVALAPWPPAGVSRSNPPLYTPRVGYAQGPWALCWGGVYGARRGCVGCRWTAHGACVRAGNRRDAGRTGAAGRRLVRRGAADAHGTSSSVSCSTRSRGQRCGRRSGNRCASA